MNGCIKVGELPGITGTSSQFATDGFEVRSVDQNLNSVRLIEIAVRNGEALLAANGALVVKTGKFTGRSPKDKYVVQGTHSRSTIWFGEVNHPLSEQHFEALRERMIAYLRDKHVYVQTLSAGADPTYRLPVTVVTELAWHSLFARQLLLRENAFTSDEMAASEINSFTIIDAPGCTAFPETDGVTSETFVAINIEKRLVLIGGTAYAGEIKKSVFTLMNYLMPRRGIFPMHCSANTDSRGGDAALFFGLSGTGKTTLSADPHRQLVGDDEHAWSDNGVFNIEGGCYAKCIHLRKDSEPQIWDAIRFGAVLENVQMDQNTRALDFHSSALTENTRAAYPIDFISAARIPGRCGHPRNIIFLTADAFGVLPPISRLNASQAMYHFLSGYTAKVAGTERGLGSQPQATFSACFGMPFLPLHPGEYAKLLGERLAAHPAQVWLVNTGWTGGPCGVGRRMEIAHTRAMLTAALRGDLDNVPYRTHPIFGLSSPTEAPGVPHKLLDPRSTWVDGDEYDCAALQVARQFVANFSQFSGHVGADVLDGGPTI